MVTCLGSFVVAALVGVLVLLRSMPLASPREWRHKLVAYPAAWLTALFVAGMAGLVAYLVLSNVVR